MKIHAPSDLARLIKNARSAHDLTQQDVADAVGITRQSLARIERGNGGASFDTVIAILDHLNIALDARPMAEPAAEDEANTAKVAPTLSHDLAVVTRLSKKLSADFSHGNAVVLPKVDTSDPVKGAAFLREISEIQNIAFKGLDPSALASLAESQKTLQSVITPLSGSAIRGAARSVPGSVITDGVADLDDSSVAKVARDDDTSHVQRDGEVT